MQKPNIFHDNTVNINFHTDPVKVIEKLVEENQQLKEEKKQLQIDKQMLLESIGLYKEKIKSLEANSDSKSTPTNSGSMTATELEKLKKELKEAHKELGVLKTDIENFKSWTKKLDWSTTEQPSWLEKYFALGHEQGVKEVSQFGDTITVSGQTVDGVFHGPCQCVFDSDGTIVKTHRLNGQNHGVRKIKEKGLLPGDGTDICWMGKNLNKRIKQNTDGSMSYLCADEGNNGVGVGVREKEKHVARGYALKNGYSIVMHNYCDHLEVNTYRNSVSISTKWYQLKK